MFFMSKFHKKWRRNFSLVAHYSLQNCLLLFAEVAPCKKSLANRYEKTSETNVYLKPLKIVELYLFILYFQLTKTRGRFRVKYNYHRKIIMLVQVDYLQ